MNLKKFSKGLKNFLNNNQAQTNEPEKEEDIELSNQKLKTLFEKLNIENVEDINFSEVKIYLK